MYSRHDTVFFFTFCDRSLDSDALTCQYGVRDETNLVVVRRYEKMF